jgi:hypothetical protein
MESSDRQNGGKKCQIQPPPPSSTTPKGRHHRQQPIDAITFTVKKTILKSRLKVVTNEKGEAVGDVLTIIC